MNANSKRERRRAFPIHAYVGANGGGKSLAAVYDTLPSLHAGRHVLSTVRLRDPLAGCRRCEGAPCKCGVHDYPDHPFWVPLTDYSQLLEAEHCDVIFDEVVGIASARDSQSMPVQVANMLVQLRRRDIVLRWTAPHYRRADVILREVSQAVTDCRGFVGKRQTGRLWSAKRLFHWRTYDGAAFEEFTAAKRQKIKPMVRQFHFLPFNDAHLHYDTLDAVLTLGWANEAGLCLTCGGRRTTPKCSCSVDSRDKVRA